MATSRRIENVDFCSSTVLGVYDAHTSDAKPCLVACCMGIIRYSNQSSVRHAITEKSSAGHPVIIILQTFDFLLRAWLDTRSVASPLLPRSIVELI
jgi:hypothetical protein